MIAVRYDGPAVAIDGRCCTPRREYRGEPVRAARSPRGHEDSTRRGTGLFFGDDSVPQASLARPSRDKAVERSTKSWEIVNHDYEHRIREIRLALGVPDSYGVAPALPLQLSR